jgi:hypothetical protein
VLGIYFDLEFSPQFRRHPDGVKTGDSKRAIANNDPGHLPPHEKWRPTTDNYLHVSSRRLTVWPFSGVARDTHSALAMKLRRGSRPLQRQVRREADLRRDPSS